ncbi:MAG: IclR family transcriptional regulator [Akkermansiaceae bacterium]|nr:IclR family transcriptional regulator [Armatimonadota bacterium]
MSQDRNNSSIYDTSRTADRVLDIFEYLEGFDAPRTVTQIAEQLSLPKATAFRLVTALRERGYLAQDRPRGGYRLGARLLRLAVGARRQIGVARAAPPILRRLAQETGESCQVSVREGGYALCVAREAAPDQKQWSLTGDVGTIFPLHATAVGKILLAHVPDADRRAYLAAPLAVSTPHTVTGPESLEAILRQVRERGYARDDEEFRVGLCAVAAPVCGADGGVVGAVGVTLLRQSKLAGDKTVARIVPALLEAARELSAELGAPTAPPERNRP